MDPTICIYEDESSKIDVVIPEIKFPPYMALLERDQNFDYDKLEEEFMKNNESAYKRRKLGEHGPKTEDVISSLTEMTSKCCIKRVPKQKNKCTEVEEYHSIEDNIPPSYVPGNYSSDVEKSTHEDDSVPELKYIDLLRAIKKEEEKKEGSDAVVNKDNLQQSVEKTNFENETPINVKKIVSASYEIKKQQITSHYKYKKNSADNGSKATKRASIHNKSVMKKDYKPDPKLVEMLFGKLSDDSDDEPNNK